MGLMRKPQWWEFLDGKEPPPVALHGIRWTRRFYAALPTEPRCKFCASPFAGFGGRLVRLIGKRPSTITPYLCLACENRAREQGGGTETRAAFVFADIRGSTPLAEQMDAREFSLLVDRFYRVATETLVRADGFIEKLAGDEVTAGFFPGFAGEGYVAKAVAGARQLLEATGHSDSAGPWVPIGVGVHSGKAFARYVGGESGTTAYAILGDDVNVAARITAWAAAGEILVSETATAAAGLSPDDFEARSLDLKGKSEPIQVRVLA